MILDLQRFGGRGAQSQSGAARGVPNDATEYYVSGEGMWINQYLRGRGDFGELSQSERQFLNDLDRATEGKVDDGTLYRSVDASAIFGDISETDYENMHRVLNYGADSLGNGRYANESKTRVENIIERSNGKHVVEKGFMSTTKDEGVADEFLGFTGADKPIVMRIQTSSKTRGVDLSGYDKNVGADLAQREVLLARNQGFTLNRIYGKNNLIYVDVKMD